MKVKAFESNICSKVMTFDNNGGMGHFAKFTSHYGGVPFVLKRNQSFSASDNIVTVEGSISINLLVCRKYWCKIPVFFILTPLRFYFTNLETSTSAPESLQILDVYLSKNEILLNKKRFWRLQNCLVYYIVSLLVFSRRNGVGAILRFGEIMQERLRQKW